MRYRWNLFNTKRPRQNSRHFPHDILKCISLNENIWFSIMISLNFVPMGTINNIPALVQIIVWRRSDDKPLSELVMVNLLTHICLYTLHWSGIRPQTNGRKKSRICFGYCCSIFTYRNNDALGGRIKFVDMENVDSVHNVHVSHECIYEYISHITNS